jgi:UDP-2,3-diacylglucosamine pyrophosphatase LpxH
VSLDSLLAIADVHLGLRSRKVSCEPEYIKDFLAWVRQLEHGGKEIEIHSKLDPLHVRKIRPPSHLLILGDAAELWDADDRSIYLCSKAVLEASNHLKSKVIYLVGNHDYLIGKKKGSYPLFNSQLEILDDTYPEQTDAAVVKTLRIGGNAYLFLHGHQFDLTFRRLGWAAMIMGYLRDGAFAFGNYSWMTSALFLFSLVGYVISGLAYIPNSFLWGMFTIVMGVFSVPRLIVSVARPLWNRIRSTRYNRIKAVKGFLDWWKAFSKSRRCDSKMLNIVYGHTHKLDYISIRQAYADAKRSFKESEFAPNIELINLPAWAYDAEQRDIIKDVFLYIDDDGFEFVEWDSEAKRPFLIPKPMVEAVSYLEALTEDELSYISELSKK